MLVAGHELATLNRVIVVVAALSLQDVRERPTEFQAQADQMHARFKDPDSDFASLLKLWDYLDEKQRELSGNQFRKLCKREYLHYLRVREWQDLVRQLHQVALENGWIIAGRANSEARMRSRDHCCRVCLPLSARARVKGKNSPAPAIPNSWFTPLLRWRKNHPAG